MLAGTIGLLSPGRPEDGVRPACPLAERRDGDGAKYRSRVSMRLDGLRGRHLCLCSALANPTAERHMAQTVRLSVACDCAGNCRHAPLLTFVPFPQGLCVCTYTLWFVACKITTSADFTERMKELEVERQRRLEHRREALEMENQVCLCVCARACVYVCACARVVCVCCSCSVCVGG